MDQPDSVEHGEVLCHRLPSDRQVFAQRGRRPGTAGQQEVEHHAPRRVTHR